MNPSIPSDFLEKERRRDEASFRRECGAEFTDEIAGWIPYEILDQCVAKSYTERPPVINATYSAAVDPAFKGDVFALAIAHRLPVGSIVLDYTATWTGTREAPLGYEWVCGEIARILKRYELNTVVGDQHCAAIIQQEFLKLGITYKEVTFGTGTRSEMFTNLKHLLIQKKVLLLDKPEELRQFRALEEHRTPRGNMDVRPAYDAKDDLAVVIALATLQLSKNDEGPTPFMLGRVARPWDGVRIRPYDHDPWAPERRYSLNVDPHTCYRQAICLNFPACMDEGYCLGFKRDPRSPV